MILILVFYFGIEYFFHLRTLKKFKYRIHVNGTRGKSSVTRLIRAGLTSGGYSVFAKTTGTLARMIFPDGKEISVKRYGKPSILEQIKILKFAKQANAEIIVIECMALEPRYQFTSEVKMIQSHIGVITNVREDHLEIMGPSLPYVAKSLAATIPVYGKLFLGEDGFVDFFSKVGEERNTTTIPISKSDLESITNTELDMFPYWEHRSNIALALKVCEDLGVSKNVALKGMANMKPDPGALTITPIHFFGKHFDFINAMAANDPESTSMIWNLTLEKTKYSSLKKFIIFPIREDRYDRTKQLLIEISKWPEINSVILIGVGANSAFPILEKLVSKEISIYVWENLNVEQIFESLISILPEESLVFAIGNIVGLGLELSQFIKNRSESHI